MEFTIEKLLALASRTKTPLAMSGLVLVVLYAIYKAVLNLDVFEPIGDIGTFLLLQNVINKLFWLALVAIVLGAIGYLLPLVLSYWTPRLESKVLLIDARLDLHDSPYEQTDENGRRKIQPKGARGPEGEER